MKIKWSRVRSVSKAERLQAIVQLPSSSEGWQTSFSETEPQCFYLMSVLYQPESELHNTAIMSQFSCFYSPENTRHPPPADYLLAHLTECMLNPLRQDKMGTPRRPTNFFFAHRFHYCYDELNEFFTQAGISCRLEDEMEARVRAERNGTHFLGNNIHQRGPQQCDHCGKPEAKLVCSRCRVALYCSPDCQKAMWKKHKPTCKKAASVATEQDT